MCICMCVCVSVYVCVAYNRAAPSPVRRATAAGRLCASSLLNYAADAVTSGSGSGNVLILGTVFCGGDI